MLTSQLNYIRQPNVSIFRNQLASNKNPTIPRENEIQNNNLENKILLTNQLS